jgi:hypothetical protein
MRSIAADSSTVCTAEGKYGVFIKDPRLVTRKREPSKVSCSRNP